jgi:hypothetical protein
MNFSILVRKSFLMGKLFPRRRSFRTRIENQISTWLSHDACFGVNVIPVIFHSLLGHQDALSTATIDLRPAGNPGFYREPLSNERVPVRQLPATGGKIWRGSDNRHLAAENIDKLRKAIESGVSQNGTDAGRESNVSLHFRYWGRTKFEDRDFLVIEAVH